MSAWGCDLVQRLELVRVVGQLAKHLQRLLDDVLADDAQDAALLQHLAAARARAQGRYVLASHAAPMEIAYTSTVCMQAHRPFQKRGCITLPSTVSRTRAAAASKEAMAAIRQWILTITVRVRVGFRA